jgi:predicted phage terminase large subunit-like protein
MKLTPELIESLSGVYLSPRYDQPQPTPEFHRECWTIYCGEAPQAAIAAPRNHAKSTALTHDYALASVLFRDQNYVIIISSSEDLAVEHLNDIANELRDNDDLRRDFKIRDFVVDQKTDIIVECEDGYQFRFIARGAEQKIRGRKWNGKRPGLIIGDDLEDDEQVESRDRRRKFRRWFFRAAVQALRDGGKIRIHGTILHEDSLLNHLMKNQVWNTRLYKAHTSFDDFSNILWEEKFNEERLRYIRQTFINEHDAAGYSQEYLNDPFDNEDAYLRRDDFQEMKEEHYDAPMVKYVGCDFAVSKEDSANRTSFTVAGRDIDNRLNFIDQRVGRWEVGHWIDEMFSIQEAHSPDMFFVEGGVIWKAVAGMINAEMLKRDIWLAITVINPVKDKKTRGRNFQKRMRAKGCRFDKKADWYEPFEAECLRFTGESEALLDDQFDSAALLVKGLEEFSAPEEDDYTPDEELEFNRQATRSRTDLGRSPVTGY